MEVEPRPYAPEGGGVRLAVRVTPRSAKEGVDGVRIEPDGRPVMLVRLNAPPVDGAANAALIAYLAKALGLRKADINIRSGEAGRVKLLSLSGDPTAITARLDTLIGPTQST